MMQMQKQIGIEGEGEGEKRGCPTRPVPGNLLFGRTGQGPPAEGGERGKEGRSRDREIDLCQDPVPKLAYCYGTLLYWVLYFREHSKVKYSRR